MEKFHQRFCYRQRNPRRFLRFGSRHAASWHRHSPSSSSSTSPRPARAPRCRRCPCARASPRSRRRAAPGACPSARHARHARHPMRAAQSPADCHVAPRCLSGAASRRPARRRSAPPPARRRLRPRRRPRSRGAARRETAGVRRRARRDPGLGPERPGGDVVSGASGAGAAPSAISDRRDPASSPLYYRTLSPSRRSRACCSTRLSPRRGGWTGRRPCRRARRRFAARGETSSAAAARRQSRRAVPRVPGQPLRPGGPGGGARA